MAHSPGFDLFPDAPSNVINTNPMIKGDDTWILIEQYPVTPICKYPTSEAQMMASEATAFLAQKSYSMCHKGMMWLSQSPPLDNEGNRRELKEFENRLQAGLAELKKTHEMGLVDVHFMDSFKTPMERVQTLMFQWRSTRTGWKAELEYYFFKPLADLNPRLPIDRANAQDPSIPLDRVDMETALDVFETATQKRHLEAAEVKGPEYPHESVFDASAELYRDLLPELFPAETDVLGRIALEIGEIGLIFVDQGA